MIRTRTVDFPDVVWRALRLAAMDSGISANQIIVASTALCIAQAANENPRLAKMLAAAEAELPLTESSIAKGRSFKWQ